MSHIEDALEECRRYGGKVLNLSQLRGPIPDFVWELPELEVLLLDNMGINQLSPRIGELAQLRTLSMRSNRLRALPPELFTLAELETLDLSRNELTELPPEVAQLTRLRRLGLEENRLRTLPDELGALDYLEYMPCTDNELDQIPTAVLEGDSNTLLRYLRGRLDPESAPQWASKMIIVGEAAVGKTSLTKMLAGERFDPDERQTHGIGRKDLAFRHPQNPDVEMTLHCWDFGGQQIYHATHRFFLTDRALFLAVFSARDGYTKGQLRTWLQAITARAPESPILIVSTHSNSHPVTLPLAGLRREFPLVAGYVAVDSESQQGKEELRRRIAEIAATLPLMGNRWPKSWMTAAADLREHGLARPFISPGELRERLQGVGVRREDDQQAVSTVLHYLGEILYYNDEPALEDVVVIRPLWVNDQITKVLDDAELAREQGVLTAEHLQQLWPGIDPAIRRFLTHLMEHVDLAYLTDTDDGKDVCLVVEKLEEDPADYGPAWEDARVGMMEIRLVYDFSDFVSLQAGIPTWFIAREHRYTTGMHWRYGALLYSDRDSSTALLRADPLSRRVELAVRGPYAVSFFSELKASFDRILAQRYPGVPYRLLVPCTCQNRSNQVCPHVFEYEDLKRRITPGIDKAFIECPKSLRDVYVLGMIQGFEPQSLEEIQRDLRKLDRRVDERFDRLDARLLLVADLLRSVTERQQEQETQCPSLFLITSERKGLSRQHHVKLRFCCEYGHQWHPIDGDAGVLSFRRPPAWFAPIAPHLRLVVSVLRQFVPVLPEAADLAGLPLSTKALDEIKLMKDFVDLIPDLNVRNPVDHLQAGAAAARLADDEGDFRWLAAALRELDPSERWGGLSRTTTPDGLTVYVCAEHLKAMRYPAA